MIFKGTGTIIIANIPLEVEMVVVTIVIDKVPAMDNKLNI
jgi:hypothetical protein